MRYVFKSLFVKKWFVLLTIIQMVFGFILLNNALLLNKSLINRKTVVTGLIGNSNIVHLSNYYSGETKKTEEMRNALEQLIDYIKSNKDVELVGSFKNGSILIGEDDIKELQNSYMTVELYDENNNMVKYLSLPGVFMDNEMYNMVKINIKSGRGLREDDFNLDKNLEIPIIVGENISKYYKPGDVIFEQNDTTGRVLTKYKVVGVLKQGQMFIGGDATLSSLEVKNMDDAILIPFSKEDNSLDDYFIRYGVNCSYKIRSGANVSQVIDNIDKKCNDLNLTLKSVKYTDEIKEINNLSNEGIFYNAFLAIMLTFFSLLGVISSVMLSILKNKEEYGIRMAVGATTKDISKGIVLEMIVIFILTIIIANTIMILFPQLLAIQITEKSDYLVFLLSCVIVFVIALIASIIPIKRIDKLDVRDLLRRDE